MKKRILLFALTICLFTGCQKEQTLTTQLTTMPEEIVQATTDVSVKAEDDHEPTEPVTSLETTMPITSAPVEETTTVETTPPTEEVPTVTIDQVIPESEPVTTEPPTETECLPEVWEDPTEPPVETAPTEAVIPFIETTEPISVGLDCDVAMNTGNQYGVDTYGWIADLSLNESNAGFNFGSWVFAEAGQAALDAAGIGQIDFLYNSLKAAYPDMEITGIRFRVHAFECGDGLYEVRVYYA